MFVLLIKCSTLEFSNNDFDSSNGYIFIAKVINVMLTPPGVRGGQWGRDALSIARNPTSVGHRTHLKARPVTLLTGTVCLVLLNIMCIRST